MEDEPHVSFLEQAVADAVARVDEAARLVPLRALQQREPPVAPRSLASALTGCDMALIAEIKRASPSRGHLAWIPDPAAHARAYVAGGAAAISVLTEPAHFHGTLADLREVAVAVDVPVIRKDFVVDDYQVWEARAAGASALLLIVAALADDALGALLAETAAAGLEALVEVHDSQEARRAAAALARAGIDHPVVGVNARDLTTLAVDPGRFAACVDALPQGAVAVAESGVRTVAQVREAGEAGAHAVLVGEQLVTAPDPESATRLLSSAGVASARSMT